MTDSAGGNPPVHISKEIADAVNGALDNMTPLLVAYVDQVGQPHLSFRGTTQAYSDNQLALWARSGEGGLPTALASNPRLTLLYRDPETRTMYIFFGRGHLVTGDAERTKIFEGSHEREQQADPERKGVAIVVDIDAIEGRTADGPFKLGGN